VALGLLAGCEKSDPLGRQAVSGTVTLNGQPLESASIMFLPVQQDKTLSGAMIEKGIFSIPAEKGLAPGEYAVKINAPDLSAPPDPSGLPVPPPSLIPDEWSQGREHKVTVKADGDNKFQFDIKK
jgi:hypothetical protein